MVADSLCGEKIQAKGPSTQGKFLMFRYGIEHEVAFIDRDGKFIDFSNSSSDIFQKIIDQLPTYNDSEQLRHDEFGIKTKRWYSEGYERFNNDGALLKTIPKAIEIRTSICNSIQDSTSQLVELFAKLKDVTSVFGLTPVRISFNPYLISFEPSPPLNEFEKKYEEATGDMLTLPVLTFGPDLNISNSELNDADVVDVGRKLTHYSPFIIPFSYSSPFYDGKLWDGYSVRTFYRCEVRPSVNVFISEKKFLDKTKPRLIKMAKLSAEKGRIEFKACDTVSDVGIYKGLLALIKGLMLDNTLNGRQDVPNVYLHKESAKLGFESQIIFEGTAEILEAAYAALGDDPDSKYLHILKNMLKHKVNPSFDLIDKYKKNGSILESLTNSYEQFNIR